MGKPPNGSKPKKNTQEQSWTGPLGFPKVHPIWRLKRRWEHVHFLAVHSLATVILALIAGLKTIYLEL